MNYGEKKTPQTMAETTFVKALGFIGAQAMDSNPITVDVKDGKIVRFRPLHYDWKYKPEEFNPWTIKAKGKTFSSTMRPTLGPVTLGYKKRVYSPNRVLYPMKRADFDIKGDRHLENRGKSGYVKISWDEALDIITSEIKRIHKKYGPYAILEQGDGHGETKTVHAAHGCQRKLLRLLGGYTEQTRNPDSWEGWYWGSKHVWGMEPVGQGKQTNIIPDVAENCEVMLHWASDSETTAWGWAGQMASRLMYWFTELGMKSIFICPDVNYSCAIHADKWIPILPNTDAALQFAIAHVWITEDTYDKEYLKTHTIGFEKIKDYVLGKEDGIPKTPKWAEPLTGVPARIIKALAREWASRPTSTCHGNGGGMIRGPYSTEPARMEVVLLGMQGLGKPGVAQVKLIEWCLFGDFTYMGLPKSMAIPDLLLAGRPEEPEAAHHGFTFWDLPKQVLPKNLIADAILNPPLEWYGTTLLAEPRENQFKKYKYPADGCSKIHMIWTDSPCWITCWNGGNRLIEALQGPEIEFFLAQQPWLENDCLFADLVLPVSTKFEEHDIAADGVTGNFNTLIYEEKCIEPLGVSKSDWEIVCMIADRLGLLKEYTGGKSEEDCIKFGFEHSNVQKFTTFEEWKKKGYYVIPTDPDWAKEKPGYRDFYEDPKKHPLKTPTGLLEFYSATLDKFFPGDQERPAYPKWIPSGETHQENLGSERSKKYPILVVSNHPRWGIHANHQDVTWFREAPTCKVRGADGYEYHPVWINPGDAAKRGIKPGDVVNIYNERGGTLAGAYVTERVMPGVISIDHGSKYDPIVTGKLDRGGAINTICPHKLTSKNAAGMATCGFLAEFEKVDLNALRNQYPEAFSRHFHYNAGTDIESFTHKGEK